MVLLSLLGDVETHYANIHSENMVITAAIANFTLASTNVFLFKYE